MVRRFNHPSSIFWSFINEGASDNASLCYVYALFAQRYRDLGVNGLITYANDRGADDVCHTTVDALGLNTYPAWYA